MPGAVSVSLPIHRFYVSAPQPQGRQHHHRKAQCFKAVRTSRTSQKAGAVQAWGQGHRSPEDHARGVGRTVVSGVMLRSISRQGPRQVRCGPCCFSWIAPTNSESLTCKPPRLCWAWVRNPSQTFLWILQQPLWKQRPANCAPLWFNCPASPILSGSIRTLWRTSWPSLSGRW